jgi:hypothetical protein
MYEEVSASTIDGAPSPIVLERARLALAEATTGEVELLGRIHALERELSEGWAAEVEEVERLRAEVAALRAQLTGILRTYSGTLVSVMETVSEASLFVDKRLTRLSDHKEATDADD